MKNRFKYSSNYIAALMAITSLAIGLSCLLLFKNSSDTGLVGIGYILSLVVVIANTLMTPVLIINTIRRIKDYKEHLKVLALVLASIPIALLYLEIL